MIIQIDGEKFMSMVVQSEICNALEYVTKECRQQMADMEKYMAEKYKEAKE